MSGYLHNLLTVLHTVPLIYLGELVWTSRHSCLVITSLILMICAHNHVLTLQGESTHWSLFGLKGLRSAGSCFILNKSFFPLNSNYTKKPFYLHWEIWVLLVVLQYISDALVNHGEQGFQRPHAREVHDVLLFECELQAFYNQSIGWEMFLNDIHKVTLNL